MDREGRQRLAPLLAVPQQTAILLDFDGTLSTIVDVPDRAVALEGIPEALSRLARRFALVGVISGRPVSYLLDRLASVDGLVLVGMYGLERARGHHVEQLPEADRWRATVEAASDALQRDAPAGIRVERKGLAVTLHVRTAPHLSGWMQAAAEEQAAITGLIAYPGRQSIELRPPIDADKGTVVRELAAGLRAVCFVGDDRGDVPAFQALEVLRGGGVVTLAVAVDSPELPAELAAAADWRVDGPPAVLEVLNYLGEAPASAS